MKLCVANWNMRKNENNRNDLIVEGIGLEKISNDHDTQEPHRSLTRTSREPNAGSHAPLVRSIVVESFPPSLCTFPVSRGTVGLMLQNEFGAPLEPVEDVDPRVAATLRESRRPDISVYEPGTIRGPGGEILPLFEVGSSVLIERRSSLLPGHPWVDTAVYRVLGIDDDGGVIRVWNPELGQHARFDFRSPWVSIRLATGHEELRKFVSRRKSRKTA